MKIAACVVLIGLALSGCGSKQAAAGMILVSAAKDAVSAAMKDPQSVEFRNVRTVDLVTEAGTGLIVCGEFNAKNGFGGYSGFEKFAWHPDGKLLARSLFPEEGRPLVDSAIEAFCSGRMPIAQGV